MEIDDEGWPIRDRRHPQDTVDCVFLGRAVEQIGEATVERDEVIARAIEAGDLEIRCRLVPDEGDPGGQLGVVSKTVLSPEGWIAAIKVCQIDFRDLRPWVSVANRRRIPQSHWLFVTRASFERFMRSAIPAATVAAEGRATAHLADILSNGDVTRKEALKACGQFNIGPSAFKRVWPAARKQAGLPSNASPGRKKSKR